MNRIQFVAGVLTTVSVLMPRAWATAQGLTLPERAERARPGPLILETLDSEVAVPSFESAVRDSDLILNGYLRSSRPYLSDDKQRVYTEYEVVPSQVILERQPRSSQEPRLLPILVRVWGGEIVLNGVRVVMSNSSMMPLPLNQPLLLFLVFDRSAGQYEIYHQRSWVLTIAANGTLHPLMKHSRAFEDGVLAMSYGRIVEAINASQKRK